MDEPEDPAIIEYAIQIEAILREYRDERDAVPVERVSGDAHAERLERIALFLADNAALVEFLAFPHAPANLETAPSLSALPTDKRRNTEVALFQFVSHELVRLCCGRCFLSLDRLRARFACLMRKCNAGSVTITIDISVAPRRFAIVLGH